MSLSSTTMDYSLESKSYLALLDLVNSKEIKDDSKTLFLDAAKRLSSLLPKSGESLNTDSKEYMAFKDLLGTPTATLMNVGFGDPVDSDLIHYAQMTILASCGDIGKNMHLLMTILKRNHSQPDKLPPSDLVFVDDDPANILAAQQFHLALPHLAKLLNKPE